MAAPSVFGHVIRGNAAFLDNLEEFVVATMLLHPSNLTRYGKETLRLLQGQMNDVFRGRRGWTRFTFGPP